MHARRMACLFLGFWLAASLFAVLAVRTGAESDRIALTPGAAVQSHGIPPVQFRALLAYAGAEQNRRLTQFSGTLQMALGCAFFLFLLFWTKEGKWALACSLWMLALTLVQRGYLTPELADLGRLTDFLLPGTGLPDRRRLWVLEQAYYGLEAVKWLAGAALVLGLVRSRGRSGNSRENVDMIDKRNHRHIYR